MAEFTTRLTTSNRFVSIPADIKNMTDGELDEYDQDLNCEIENTVVRIEKFFLNGKQKMMTFSDVMAEHEIEIKKQADLKEMCAKELIRIYMECQKRR